LIKVIIVPFWLNLDTDTRFNLSVISCLDYNQKRSIYRIINNNINKSK